MPDEGYGIFPSCRLFVRSDFRSGTYASDCKIQHRILKIGAGPIPIETSEGWLLFYHGVLRSCNGYVYAFGSALLDLDEPWKVKFRSGPYLISPREPYECMGDVPNVCFPCAALHDPATGRVAVYYGCADTVTGLAFGYIPEIIEFTKRTSII